MSSPDLVELRAWAASGAMALTGRPDGPPMACRGRPATAVLRALGRIAAVHPEACLPGVELLGERAAVAGLGRQGPWSCGGAFRAISTLNGWFGISLPRSTDLDLVPALVRREVVGDVWEAVGAWAVAATTQDAVRRAQLLGLAAAGIPSNEPRRDAVVVSPGPAATHRRERPRVLDLTGLWAGPLCAHLLGRCGALVTKVESSRRPDGARRGPRAFFDVLHEGHRMVALDFRSAADVVMLRRLVADSDLVLESSRARAMTQLGIDAEEVVSGGTSWLSITAYGRSENRVGFGDDVAFGAGLHRRDGDDLLPCGDALADPLAGVRAAAEAVDVLAGPRAALVDVSMHHVAREAATGGKPPHEVVRRRDGWWVETPTGDFPVAPPTARGPGSHAGELGADNHEVLS